MAMSKTTKWILGILSAFFLCTVLLVTFLVVSIFEEDDDESLATTGSKVAIVEVKETIVSPEETVRLLKKYREHSSVKAIVLRVESPGGGVAASQEIYEEVKKTRSFKPVVVSMGSIAASGGYYISCGATKIVANPGTITGSIGVIINFIHFKELLEKIGIDETTIKSGKLKDAGSPFRKMTEEEKKFFGELLTDVYEQFVAVVVEERKLPRATVLKYADGRVFTGKQAYAYGFVDTLGTLEDAITIAAGLGGIEGKPKVIKEQKRKSLLERLLGDATSSFQHLKSEIVYQPILQYKFIAP
ncbi:MAG: signal peptide peptidase SppA [Bacteroidetes bacterium]|nr:signal peptide peptidase SppA [Bacteroidota bacterium]